MYDIVNIEASLLSTIILDNELYENVSLKKEHFLLPFHKKVFSVLQELYRESKPLTEDFILKKMGHTFQDQLIDILSSYCIGNVESYVNEIKESFQKRNTDQNLRLLLSNINDSSILSIEEKLKSLIVELENNTISNALFQIESTKNIKPSKPLFFLENILPIQQYEVNMFSASGGSGKSYLGLYILSLLEKYHGLKTLGYFSEDDKAITKYRLEKLRKIHGKLVDIDIVGKESRPQSFLQKDKNRNLIASEFFLKFKKQLKSYDLILVDPLIAFIFEDENSNTEARAFMNLLNEWCIKDKKTLILIHHHNKGENGSVRGASAFIDAVRLHYVIKTKKNNDTDRFIQLEKINHAQKKQEYKVQLFQDEGSSSSKKVIENKPVLMEDIL